MTLADAIVLVDRLFAANRAATDGLHATADYDRWKKARGAADEASEAALILAGATVKTDWQGGVIKLAGVRSTSTGGLPGAMGNWLRAARLKLADANGSLLHASPVKD